MKYHLSEIKNINPDFFKVSNSARRTSIIFWARIIDDILDTGHMKEWKPIGKTTALPMDKFDIAVLFENSVGETTWFYIRRENQ